MIEYLCSEGHDHAQLLEFSTDKLNDLFEDALARTRRRDAAQEIMLMNAVATGAGCCVSKKGVQFFNKMQRALVDIANGVNRKTDVKSNLQALTQNLLSIGARPSYLRDKSK